MRIWQSLTLVGLVCAIAFGQPSTQPKYVQIDYMRVEPGKGQQYIKMEQDLWRPVHLARINNKTIDSWALYSVRYPAGTNREYDFATATVYNAFAAMESPYKDIDFEKLHANMTNQEFGERTSTARKLIRSDVFYTIERAGTPSKWKYLEVQYMK